jgi:fucose permease
VWLSITFFFVYTGIEAAAGTWAYSLFTESRGLSMMTAGLSVSIYWGGLTAGRLLSGFIAGYVPVFRMLRLCMLGIALGAAFVWTGGASLLSLIGLAMMGFACAPVFPTMISTTPMRLGRSHTANAIGFQIAAAVLGQSLLPALIGLMARRLGLEIVGPSLLISAAALVGLHFLLTAERSSAAGELTDAAR